MKLMQKKRIKHVEVTPHAQAAFNDEIQNKLTDSVWNSGGCQSWYIHPVSGKNVTLWPGFTWQFRQKTRRFDSNAYFLDGQGQESNFVEVSA